MYLESIHISKYVFSILLLTVLLANSASAQSRSEQRIIDDIQENPNLIFAVGSDRDAGQAEQDALASLVRTINSAYRGTNSALSTTGQLNPFTGRELAELIELYTWQTGRTRHVMAFASRADVRESYLKERLASIIATPGLHWGLAYDASSSIAENLARTTLLSSIQVTIMTEQNLIQTDDGVTITDEFQNRVRAFSNLTLQGLRTIGPLRMDDVYIAFTYLTPDGLASSMENTRNTVLSYVREAERNEAAQLYSRALQNYYKAFIYTSSYLGNMQGTLDGEEILDMRIALRNKIRIILDGATVRTRPAFEASRGTTITRFELIKGAYRFSNLIYRFDFENTSISDEVNFGEGQISFQNYIPVRLLETFPISLSISLGNDIYSDAYLGSMEPLVRLSTTTDVPVDFRNVIRVDMECEVDNGRIIFRLQPRNLMIRSARWVINNSSPQFGTEVLHTFTDEGIFPLSVQINGEEELSFERWYDTAKNQILLIKPTDELVVTAEPTAPSIVLPAFEQFPIIRSDQQVLFQIRNWGRLLSELQRRASEGRLSFGPSDDFDHKDGLIAVIFDRNNVYDYLYHEGEYFKSFLTENVYTSLDEIQSGETDRYLAWIKFE